MFGFKRPDPQLVFLFSLLAVLLSGFAAVRYGMAQNWLPTALWGVLTLVFINDARVSWGRVQQKKLDQAAAEQDRKDRGIR